MDFIRSEAKNIIFFIAILVGAFLLYQYYSSDEVEGDGLVATDGIEEQEDIGAGILQILLELNSVDIDDQFFKTEVFNNLEDPGSVIANDPVGRPNPFESIPGRQGGSSLNVQGI